MNSLFSLLFIASVILFVIGLSSPEKSLFWEKGEKTKKKSKIIYAGFASLFLLLFISTSNKDTNSSFDDNYTNVDKTQESKNTYNNKDDNSNMPTEQKLAILDAETYVDKNDLKVLRIKTLLNKLASMYKEPKENIAEYTSKAQGVLHDRGIQESCLNILEGMRKVRRVDNTPYKDAVALYIMYIDYNH